MLRETVTGQPRAAIARVPSAFVRVPATVAEWLAAGILAASTIGVVVALPNLRVDIGMVRFFYPFFGSVVAISHAVTALILFWRAELARERRVAVLGGTYLFAALLALANVLALPTSMSGANLFGPHAAAWYRVVGHLAWPLGIVIFAWMPGNRNRGPARPLLLALVAATIAIGFGVLNATLLPPLVDDRGAFLPAYYFAFAISSLLSVAAICSLLRRKPTSLELWVAMSVLFLLAETILSIRAGVRFSLGSYIGRGFGVASALVVFVALTGEYIALLRRANVVERFATIAEAAPVITFIVDNDGRCTFVNGRWTALTGQAANDAFGAGYRNVIDSGDLERVEAPWRMANRARHEFSTELRFYDAHTQRHRWHLIRSSALGDASGRVEAWLVTATDIDDQRRALDEARAAQLEFRRIAEAIPQIVWTARPNGMIDWANANWYAYSGLTTAASLDVAWRTVSHPDDRAEILSRWRDAVANGQPVEMEFRLLRKDGAYRWFLTRVVPVRDNAGTLVRWYGTSTDIDERRRQGDELTRLYEREHSVAKALQSAFLPPFLPDIPGIAFDAVYRPAARETEVGGDWYDAFLLPDERVAISVGDVMGHGLEAATAMVRVRESLRAAAMLPDLAPDDVLRAASRALATAQSDVFATATYGVLDRNAATFSYACAGHPGPLLRRTSFVTSLAGGGTLLGLEGVAASTHVISLRTGDVLAFYTDGLVESERDIARGEQRLVDALRANGRDAAKIVASALTLEPRDDVALLTVAIDALPVTIAADGPNWKFASDDARTAQVARSSFVAYLRAHDVVEADIAGAEIVFGELVGNVVRHAPGPIDVELAWNSATPQLFVRDRGAGFEPRSTALPADDYSENGRGLYLIKTFASAPSVRRRADGGAEITVQLALQNGALGTRSA
jgi:PAS domain S-box-containing protein